MGKAGPWISGPKEILEHAATLLTLGTDADLRIAFLTIDNAVELLIKTYISLPERITGKDFSKSKFNENLTYFPRMLEIIEENSKEQLEGIKLAEIEWYHRLRNQLYHQGNGLSIERDKVESYYRIGEKLLLQLFNYELGSTPATNYGYFLEFITAWHRFENSIVELVLKRQYRDEEIEEFEINSLFKDPREMIDYFREAIGFNAWPDELIEETYHLERLFKVWSGIQSGELDFRKSITEDDIKHIEKFIDMCDHFRRSLSY